MNGTKFLIVWNSGSGRTTKAIELAKEIVKEQNPKRCIFFYKDKPSNTLEDFLSVPLYIEPTRDLTNKEFSLLIKENWDDSLVIIDEYNLSVNWTSPDWNKVVNVLKTAKNFILISQKEIPELKDSSVKVVFCKK